MKICWDNLEAIKLTKNGTFRKGSVTYIYKECCEKCSEPYLTINHKQSKYCSNSCASFDRKFSKESRRKMSELKKGKNLSKEHKIKISNASRAEKNGFYGKKHTLAARLKMSFVKKDKFIGHENPNWKGGISCEPYCQDWTNILKEYIKERDGYKCLNPYCQNEKIKLFIHHINYNKKDCQPENLITVCNSCNSRANSDRDWHKSWYQAIINKRYGGK